MHCAACLSRRGRMRRHVHGQHDGGGDRDARHVAAIQFVDPGGGSAKVDECVRAGAAMRKLLELDLKPRDIMTRAAFENAMVVVTVLGGSTNAVLHLLAMARVGGRAFELRISRRSATGLLCWPISSRAAST